MAVRKDGIESKKKLLDSAMLVFAEKGYNKATISDICKLAGSNVAAVNYHFGSKEELYIAAWRKAFRQAIELFPPDGGLPKSSPAEQRLFALINSALCRILGAGESGPWGQILLKEMAEPTSVILEIHHEVIQPLRNLTREIISELLGPNTREKELVFCEMSVVHQFIAVGLRKSRNKLPSFFRSCVGNDRYPEFINDLAKHITAFSLAGIKAVREEIESNLK